MLKIAHRINEPAQLSAVPAHYGVEMDLHAYGDRLVVHHDPFQPGVPFEQWLDAYRHALVILNIKEEGIEPLVKEMVEARGIHDFFFLDVSAPVLFKMAKSGEKRVAVRVSAVEPVEAAYVYAGKVDWVFIDMHTDEFPLSDAEYRKLREECGFKTCLVSPDVWLRPAESTVKVRDALAARGIALDAVLTKKPELWPES